MRKIIGFQQGFNTIEISAICLVNSYRGVAHIDLISPLAAVGLCDWAVTTWFQYYKTTFNPHH